MPMNFRTKESGFSLMEILVVLMAASILAAIGIPVMSTVIDQYNLVLAAQGVSSQLQFARMKAITSNESLRVNFPASTRQYQVELSDGTIFKGPFFYPKTIRPNNVDSDTPITFPGSFVAFQTNGTIPTSGNGSAGRVKLINQAGMRIDIVVSSGGVIKQTPTYKQPPAPF
jgi:prepilin-type N-terminal cleavage/methylation domain-containing protein